MTLKKLSEYPVVRGHYQSHMANITIGIPALVCDAADAVIAYTWDALCLVCDECEHKGTLLCNDAGEALECVGHPDCVINKGYAAWHKYREVTKDV